MDTKAYSIPEENLATLQAAIAKLNKRAAKLEVTGITLTVGAHKDVGYMEGGRSPKPTETPAYFVRYFEVTVAGEKIHLDGWSFVATIAHLSDDSGAPVNIVKSVPGSGDLPLSFRTASNLNCDHCNKSISTRKETFALRHEDGTWKQIGRSCLQDFLGGKSAQAVAFQLEALLTALDEAEHASEGSGGSSSNRMGLETFLQVVAACIRVDGWLSRGKARDMDLAATADNALFILFPPMPGTQAHADWKVFKAGREITDEDRATVEKTLAYVRETIGAKESRSDYEHNLVVSCSQVGIEHKLAGIAASAVSCYLKAMEADRLRSIELARVGDSKHVGTIGTRDIFEAQCVKKIELETQFGRSVLHRFVDASGNALVWFASSGELETGNHYVFKATPGKHDIRDGVKQTVLKRLTVLEPEEATKERAKAARKAAKAAKSVTA